MACIKIENFCYLFGERGEQFTIAIVLAPIATEHAHIIQFILGSYVLLNSPPLKPQSLPLFSHELLGGSLEGGREGEKRKGRWRIWRQTTKLPTRKLTRKGICAAIFTVACTTTPQESNNRVSTTYPACQSNEDRKDIVVAP